MKNLEVSLIERQLPLIIMLSTGVKIENQWHGEFFYRLLISANLINSLKRKV